MTIEIWNDGKPTAKIAEASAHAAMGRNGDGVVLTFERSQSSILQQFPSVNVAMTADEARAFSAEIARQCDEFATPYGGGLK